MAIQSMGKKAIQIRILKKTKETENLDCLLSSKENAFAMENKTNQQTKYRYREQIGSYQREPAWVGERRQL